MEKLGNLPVGAKFSFLVGNRWSDPYVIEEKGNTFSFVSAESFNRKKRRANNNLDVKKI